MTERPRCAYCNKLAPKLTTTVWVHGADTKAEHRQSDGSWWRHLYLPVQPRNIHDCQQLSNQEVLSVRYGYGNIVSRFSEWDGESYWLPKSPCCTVECLQRYAQACHAAGYQIVRTHNAEEIA
jgi:hypothetical protein